MSKVFLIQRPRRDFDLASAEKYGDIVQILAERDNAALAVGPALTKIRRALLEFSAADDYLLAAGGDPFAVFLVASILNELAILPKHAIKWLRWDRHRDADGRRDMKHGEYVPVVFNMAGKVQGDWNGR